MDESYLVFVLILFGIVAVGYSYHYYKGIRARRLLAASDEALAQGDASEAVALLKRGLWKANEEPKLERMLLKRLEGIFADKGLEYDFSDYHSLVAQYEMLSKKGSTKAIHELIDVQKLKERVIERLPDLS